MSAAVSTRLRRRHPDHRHAVTELDGWLEALARDIARFDGSSHTAAAIFHAAEGTARAARRLDELDSAQAPPTVGGQLAQEILAARDRRVRGLVRTIESVKAARTLRELARRCKHLAFVADDLGDITRSWQS